MNNISKVQWDTHSKGSSIISYFVDHLNQTLFTFIVKGCLV